MRLWFRRSSRHKCDSASTCTYCDSPAKVTCVSCTRGACTNPWHVYTLFSTRRYGTDADQIGSKFAYHCPSCRGFVCVDELGIRETYPCPTDRVEYYPFTCPRCTQRLFVLRMDNVDAMEAAEEIRRYLEHGDAGEAQVVPYEGYDRVLKIKPGVLMQVPFGPRPRALRCGEVWETVIRLRDAQGEVAELVLEHNEQQARETTLYLRQGQRRIPLDAPAPEEAVWSTEQLRAVLPRFGGRHLTLRLGREGLSVAQVDDRYTVEVERVGIRPLDSPPAQPKPPTSSRPTDRTRHPKGPLDDRVRHRREHLAKILHELTELHIWDYTWLEAPPSHKMGSKAVLTLAGSTDLTYYHLILVYFRGVRYNTIPSHFSHPHFSLASLAEEAQLRELASFGKRSFAVRVLTDFGGSLQKSAYVVADWIEVKQLEDDERTQVYQSIHPANTDWW